MTGLPHGATSVVSIERRDNVVYLGFPTSPTPPGLVEEEDTWWPWSEGAEALGSAPGETSTATRPIPARLSPRPCRVLADRFARSQLAADLHHYARQMTFLVGVLVGLALSDRLHDLAHILTGGTP